MPHVAYILLIAQAGILIFSN